MKGNYFIFSDLKVVLLVAVPPSFERFTFFLLGLSDLDDSAIFKFCFEFFSKDSFMSKRIHLSKNVVSKRSQL